MIPVIVIVGPSKSGKTTLIEYLISNLSRDGLRVGTIKHVHHSSFSIDVKAKDTWRHSQAGAQIVACVAPKEIAVIKKRGLSYLSLEEILELINKERLDLILLEGFHSLVAKKPDIYKILMAKNEADLKQLGKGTVEPILAMIVVSDLKTEKGRILELVKKEVLRLS